MSINRVSSAFLTNQSINFLNGNLNILSDLQEKLASGRNINNPSDDPVGLTRVLDLTNTLSTDERYARNIESALAELNTSDSVLSSVTELIHRAKELTVQGASFTLNQQGRDSIALEINEIIDQLVQLGNTSIGQKFIFGGKDTLDPPFNRNAAGNVFYLGNASTLPWERPVEIADNVEVNININGDLLLGQAEITAATNPPTFSAASGGLFQTLLTLHDNLLQGRLDDPLGVPGRLDDLDNDLNNVLAEQARVGSITNRLELTLKRIEQRKEVFTRQFSDIQTIDMPKLVSDLNFQETVFQGSLATTARVLQTSLLTFLR